MHSPEAIKAAELVNAVAAEQKHTTNWKPSDANDVGGYESVIALARYIREVSDAVKALNEAVASAKCRASHWERSNAFILPDPVDPLVEAVNHGLDHMGALTEAQVAHRIQQHLTAAGYEIRKVGPASE